MGKVPFATYPVFREGILELDAIYERVTGSSLVKTTGLFSKVYGLALPNPWPVEITLLAMTMFQITMTDLLATIGIKPTAVIGHSAGETPMIYGAGAGPKEMALEITIARSKAMKVMESLNGGMAVLGCDEATGSSALIDEVVSLASIANVFAQRVQTLSSSHSSMTEVCKEEYLGNARAVFEEFPELHSPTIPCYLTVAGHREYIREFTTDYLWESPRHPVHFHQVISSILGDHPDVVFIEISPPPSPLFLCLRDCCLVRSGGASVS